MDDDDHDDALDRPFELSHIVAHRTVCGALRARRKSTAPPSHSLYHYAAGTREPPAVQAPFPLAHCTLKP